MKDPTSDRIQVAFRHGKLFDPAFKRAAASAKKAAAVVSNFVVNSSPRHEKPSNRIGVLPMKKSLVLAALFATTVATNLAHADSIKPGLWEFTMQMDGAGMPNMPAMPKLTDAQRKQMEAMGMKMPQTSGSGIAITNKVCITPEQAKKGVPPNVDKDGEKCEQTDVKSSGNTTRWKIVCTGQHKMTGTGSATYDNAEHMSGDSTMNMDDGPHGPMTMNTKFNAKFLAADCKPGK